MSGGPEQAPPEGRRDPNVLISLVTAAAAAALAATAPEIWDEIGERPWALLAFLGLTLVLQLIAVEVYNRGSFSFGGVGLLALGFMFGSGWAMAAGAIMGIVNLIARRGRLNRGVFDAAQFALAAGAGTAFYQALGGETLPTSVRFLVSVGSAALYMVVNAGLLSLAISLAEGESQLDVWRERFEWLTPYYLAAGPMALALVIAYDKVGVMGLVAFTLPPVMMMVSTRQYVTRTRQSVEEIRAANQELGIANAKLAERNDDLQALFQFAAGLASRAHDRATLTGYAEQSLARLVGTRAEITLGDDEGGTGLYAGGARIGALHMSETDDFESDRWERLRDTILPQLATAIESASLVERERELRLATIAALARSMEAKDYYTGSHTERVAEIAVALAKRLGYSGVELDAIEIGAILHDIGKIGIPERILHKPGPLDEEEWTVMKEHPVISAYILADVDLHPIVLQIARSSHERIDGTGYPDGLAGDEVPLPARIVLVADAFDAITSDRPYRSARTVTAAMDELRLHTGTQFCPSVVAAMEQLFREEPQLLGVAALRAVGDAAA